MGKIKRVITGLVVALVVMTGIPAAANAYTQTFPKRVVCTYSASGVGYGWIDTYSRVDYDWYEEVILGYHDYERFLRRDRAYQYDSYCRTWYA
jgi:hypothetical protein